MIRGSSKNPGVGSPCCLHSPRLWPQCPQKLAWLGLRCRQLGQSRRRPPRQKISMIARIKLNEKQNKPPNCDEYHTTITLQGAAGFSPRGAANRTDPPMSRLPRPQWSIQTSTQQHAAIPSCFPIASIISRPAAGQVHLDRWVPSIVETGLSGFGADRMKGFRWVAHLVRPLSAGVEVGNTNCAGFSCWCWARRIRVPHLTASLMRWATQPPELFIDSSRHSATVWTK